MFFSSSTPGVKWSWEDFNPADLIEWVGANFSHLYVVHKTLNKSFVLEHVENANCLKILEDVLKNGWLVIDLLVTNAEDRLSQTIIPYTIIAQSDARSPEVADDELNALNQRIATLNAELDAQRSARQAAEAAQVAAEAAMNAAEAARVAAETAMNAACARLLIMDGTLESMHASMSWRLTAPLRGFASRHPRFVQGVLAFIERHPWLGRDAATIGTQYLAHSHVAARHPTNTLDSHGRRPFQVCALTQPRL